MAGGRICTGRAGSMFSRAVSDDLPSIRKTASGGLSTPAALMPSVIFEVLKSSTRVSLLASATNRRSWPGSNATPRGRSMPESVAAAVWDVKSTCPRTWAAGRLSRSAAILNIRRRLFSSSATNSLSFAESGKGRGVVHGGQARSRGTMVKVRLAENITWRVTGDRVVGLESEH
jgi:hypothetical protein